LSLTWEERIAELGAQDLPLCAKDMVMAGQLNWEHRDPFDRMLAV
jgi:pilT protein domain protein